MKKKIFITGAAGFIGFHVANHLRLRGDEVIGYDNFNSYYDPQLKRSRAHELKKIGVEVIHGDVCSLEDLTQALIKQSIDCLVHLSAQAGVRYSLQNPHAFVKSNLDGFINILEACRHLHLKLVYASSSSVYGLNSKVPFSESDRCDAPVSFYGATKKSNELMAYSYHHLFGIPMSGLRFFTVYGPWGRPDMAYFSFTKSIVEDKQIELYNHGDMERDFTYIDDIVDGVAAAIDLNSSYDIFNLGNHKPEKLMTLVQILEKNLGKKAHAVLCGMQPGDVLRTYADIEHSQNKLNFFPKISLEQGLEKFVAWYKQYFGM
jgi:UDP-glucuronate 4-epimerase